MKEQIRLVRHDDKVCLLVNGQLVADLPQEVALALGANLISMAKQIENDLNPTLINDQAILMRAGVPLGFTNDPKILRESFKEAQWDRGLRKAIPNAPGIESKEVVGTPIITRGEKCLAH